MQTEKKTFVFILVIMAYSFVLSYAKKPGEDRGGIQKLKKFNNVIAINNLKDYSMEIILNEDANVHNDQKAIEGIFVKSENETSQAIESTIVEKLRIKLIDLKDNSVADSGNIIIGWANMCYGEIIDILRGVNVIFKGNEDNLLITVKNA